MIPVEEALRLQHDSALFTALYRADCAADRLVFPSGLSDVDQFSFLLRAPVYLWARPMQRVVADSLSAYPLAEARVAIHHFEKPAMLWLFEQPIGSVIRPDDGQPAPEWMPRERPIDALVMCAWHRGQRSTGDLIASLMSQVNDTDARERERDRIEQVAQGIQVYGLTRLRTPTSFHLRNPLTGQSSWPSVGFLIPVIATVLEFGTDLTETGQHINIGDPTIEQELDLLRRWTLAGAALLRQRILTTTIQRPSAIEGRRLQNDDIPASSVQVIQLRATASTPSNGRESPMEWAHRWIVRGHWRDQWYASQQEHRVIWVPSYVKGPEDKPLIIRPTIYAVAR